MKNNVDIIKNGELMETLIETGGWRLLEKTLNKIIDEYKVKLVSATSLIKSDADLMDIRAMGVYIKAYEFIKNFPKELIDKKDRELNKLKVEGEKREW